MSGADIENLFRDPEQGQLLLGLHFLDQRVGADDVRISRPQNGVGMFGAKVPYPAEEENKLWFYQTESDGETTLMVDGLGVAAEVTEADVGATNGVIHVVNKVFGIPQQTVYDKLAQDPMLS